MKSIASKITIAIDTLLIAERRRRTHRGELPPTGIITKIGSYTLQILPQ